MSLDEFEQKREYYRVEFPEAYRPVLLLGSESFEIHDVSEFGLKFMFMVQDVSMFNLDDGLKATIRFPDKEEFSVQGRVVRVSNDYVAVQLNEPIPLSKIRAEHLYIISNFQKHQE